MNIKCTTLRAIGNSGLSAEDILAMEITKFFALRKERERELVHTYEIVRWNNPETGQYIACCTIMYTEKLEKDARL